MLAFVDLFMGQGFILASRWRRAGWIEKEVGNLCEDDVIFDSSLSLSFTSFLLVSLSFLLKFIMQF